MGAGQTAAQPQGEAVYRSPRPNSSSCRSTDSIDAPHSPRTPQVKYFQSLDRSMKAFLRASNLPGLEYRLKLAGYRTFADLLRTNREALVASGFTGIMARQLMNAVEHYRAHGQSEQLLPFQLVRRGQRLPKEPSERMKLNPNFRKQNLKRSKSLDGASKTRRPASTVGGAVLGSKTAQGPSKVRVMSRDDLALQHLLSPSPEMPPPSSSSAVSRPDKPPEEEDGRKVLGMIVNSCDFSSRLEETDFPAGGVCLSRSFSIPAEFQWMTNAVTNHCESTCHLPSLARRYSSPPSLL